MDGPLGYRRNCRLRAMSGKRLMFGIFLIFLVDCCKSEPYFFQSFFSSNIKDDNSNVSALVLGNLMSKVRNIWFLSLSFCQTRELSFAQFVYFLRKVCVCFFQFLNDKIHNYVKKTLLWILSFKNWKVNTLPSKNIQTEQN